MNDTKQNPVLDFVLNVADTCKYVWNNYIIWIAEVSWGKLLLACFLILIIGGSLCLHAFTNFIVLASLLLKCFIDKDDQAGPAPQTKVEKDITEEVDKANEKQEPHHE